MNNNKFPIIEKLRAWFHRQPSEQRKKIKKYGTIGVFAVASLGIYYLTGQNNKQVRAPETKTDITPDKTSSLIQDDIITTLDGKIKTQADSIDQKVQDAVTEAIKKGQFGLVPPQNQQQPNSNADQTGLQTSADPSRSGGNADYPGGTSYPAPVGYTEPNQSTSDNAAPAEEKTVAWLGSISDGSDEIPLSAPAQDSAEKKDQIQLPVGFMKAKLLAGVNALTGEFGTDNPQTIMFRVQAPAQLPNFIKMNLRGCFSVANVSGNLSSERIIVLPVSIHCMTMDGKYIVEGPVKGFVTDKDGKRDMSARVVSRAGRLLATAVFAKTVEGFANVMGSQTLTQNVSPLGSVNTIKPDEATKNAAATGLSGGLTEVSKLLMKLAEQTSPALETGPGKDVTLFVQETAELTIKQVRIK